MKIKFKRMKAYIISLLFFLLLLNCSGQGNDIYRNSFFSPGFAQVKEGANFGLVFNGPALNYGMNWDLKNDKRIIIFGYELGVGVLFSKSIPALGIHLKPAEFAYMFRFPGTNSRLFIGPSLKFEYNYYLYPQLQSGFDYWFTDFSCGVNARYDFKYKSSAFRINANSSIMGFISRQADYRDPYFFDLGFKHAIRHLHQDMTFASLDKYNTAKLEILWKPGLKSRFTLGYVFAYSGYYQNPDINMVSHSIKIVINEKQK